MTKKNSVARSGNPIWQFFTSVKLTVIVLLLLAVTSIIGTLIPQNGSEAFYIQKYGEVFYGLFNALDIFDMYSAWWFILLMLMLAVNIVVCSIDKLNSTWKIIFPKKVTFNLDRFRRLKNRMVVSPSSKTNDLDRLATASHALIGKLFGRVTMEKSDKGVVIFAERGRWTRIGVYVVHVSILFMLVGAVIGSVWGYKAFVAIPEGETIDTVTLRGSDKVVDLGFTLRCDRFDVSFYDTGQPKEFKSHVVINDGEHEFGKEIIVNDPLRYKGLSFYQSSYGTDSAKNVIFKMTSRESGMVYSLPLTFGQSVDMPESGGTFTLNRFVRGYNFRGHNLGEGFVGTLTYLDTIDHGADAANKSAVSTMPKAMAAMMSSSDANETGDALKGEGDVSGGDGVDGVEPHMHQVEIFVPVKFPTFDKMRGGRFVFEIEDYEKRYYTGLQVTKDPGVWYVYIGFLMMIAGCWITFFISHQQICVEIVSTDEDEGELPKLSVCGTANRNNQGMKLKVARLAEKLKLL